MRCGGSTREGACGGVTAVLAAWHAVALVGSPGYGRPSASGARPHASLVLPGGALPPTPSARMAHCARLRGGRGSGFDDYSDSDSVRAEGPSGSRLMADDDDDDDADLVDLSGLDKSGEQERSSAAEHDAPDMRERGGAGEGEGIEALLDKFLQRQDEASDSGEDEISNEWIRNLPEDTKDDPEFMAAFSKLEETLIASRKRPPPSLAEKVQEKFVAAAQEGKEELVKSLFHKYSKSIKGDLINARCGYVNITALMHAAANGHFHVVKALLKRGADIGARGNQDETAMHLAASGGFSEVCVLLYEHDADLIHARDCWNTTPIMRSIDQGWAHTTKTLYNLGSRLESWGPQCIERSFCQGMRWPIMRMNMANETENICPLCIYGYILPDSPEVRTERRTDGFTHIHAGTQRARARAHTHTHSSSSSSSSSSPPNPHLSLHNVCKH